MYIWFQVVHDICQSWNSIIFKSNSFVSQLLFFWFYKGIVAKYFSKKIMSLPGYLPKLEFKYFDISCPGPHFTKELFHLDL